MLRVLAEAQSRGHQYTLTIVENGPDQLKLKDLAKELHLSDQIQFIEFQKNAARLTLQHQIFVHAARVEIMPITLIEALSLGKPYWLPRLVASLRCSVMEWRIITGNLTIFQVQRIY
jgi:glycosyltransferase involved in cell wall biosynthesis